MTQSLGDHIAAELRAVLARYRIPATELAEKLGEEETWVRRRASGQRGISVDDLQRIADALGMQVGQFLPESERVA